MSFEKDAEKLLRINVEAVVDDHDSIKINTISGQATTIFEVSVNSKDTGSLVGKKGRTAEAIRRIMYVFSQRHKKSTTVEIID